MLSIEEIKNRKLVCLDFDDCIIAWNNYTVEVKTWKVNTYEDILKILKENVNLINNFCNKYGFEVFIISSWSPIIQEDLTLLPEDSDPFMEQLWSIIKTLPIIGKDPFRDRILAMEVLIENGNRIVCIDDFDLSAHFEWADDKFYMINLLNGEGLKEKLDKFIKQRHTNEKEKIQKGFKKMWN